VGQEGQRPDGCRTSRPSLGTAVIARRSSSGNLGRWRRWNDHPVNGPLNALIEAWCDRRDLRPLALLLPASTANAGLTDDSARLMEALYDLRARGRLPDGERAEIERIIPLVERIIYRT